MIFEKWMDGSESDQEFRDFISKAVSNIQDTAESYLALCKRKNLERNGLKLLTELLPDFQEEVIDSLSQKPREMGLWLQEMICLVGEGWVNNPNSFFISALRKVCRGQGKFLVKKPIIAAKTRPLDKVSTDAQNTHRNHSSLRRKWLNKLIADLKTDHIDLYPMDWTRAEAAANNHSFPLIVNCKDQDGNKVEVNPKDALTDWYFAQFVAERLGVEGPEQYMIRTRCKV